MFMLLLLLLLLLMMMMMCIRVPTHSSRSWFRASSFIKLSKNQLDAPLF
jgi:hypothetical protein